METRDPRIETHRVLNSSYVRSTRRRRLRDDLQLRQVCLSDRPGKLLLPLSAVTQRYDDQAGLQRHRTDTARGRNEELRSFLSRQNSQNIEIHDRVEFRGIASQGEETAAARSHCDHSRMRNKRAMHPTHTSPRSAW